MRADQLLVARGLAPTRSVAQRLIARDAVRWLGPAGWTSPRKSGDELPEGCELRLVDDAEARWVSRGGLKLEGALERSRLDVTRWTCLDVGQSTGGFTEVLLARGAKRVIGVDVGHGQLHERLRGDPRVVAIEGVNARFLDATDLGAARPAGGFDLVTGDLSFISLTLVLPAVVPFLGEHGHLLMLVKPQFELQPGDLGKGGRVRDPSRHGAVRHRIEAACSACGLRVVDWFDSPITGGDGNREFFVHAVRAAQVPDDTQRPESTP